MKQPEKQQFLNNNHDKFTHFKYNEVQIGTNKIISINLIHNTKKV